MKIFLTLGKLCARLLSMKALLSKFLTLVFLIAVTFSPQVVTAQAPGNPQPPAQAEPTPGSDLGYGVGAVLLSILYGPVKVTYAALGLLIGGTGWVFSAGNPYVANNIIYPAVTGDYVITPDHLKGKEPLIFYGAPPPPNHAQPQTSAPAEPPRP
jgi:hypothetical protein